MSEAPVRYQVKPNMSELNLPDPSSLRFEDIPPAIAQLAALQGFLAARLLAEKPTPQMIAEEPEDEMLTVKEAAAMLGVEQSFVYRHAKTLPFARRLNSKCLRFSKRGLIAWRDRKRG